MLWCFPPHFFFFIFCTTRISRVSDEEAYVVQHEKCIYFIIVKRSPRCWAAYKSWWEVYSSRIIIQHFLNTGIVLAWVVPLFVAPSPPQTKFSSSLKNFHTLDGWRLRTQERKERAKICTTLCCTHFVLCVMWCLARDSRFFSLPISTLWVN